MLLADKPTTPPANLKRPFPISSNAGTKKARLQLKSSSPDYSRPLALRKPPTRGVEYIQLPSHVCSQKDMNELVVATTERLAHSNKRVSHFPRLLADGICFDWLLDYSVKNEDAKYILSHAASASEGLPTHNKPERNAIAFGLRQSNTSETQPPQTATVTPEVISILSDSDDDVVHEAQYAIAESNPVNTGHALHIDVETADIASEFDMDSTEDANVDSNERHIHSCWVMLRELSVSITHDDLIGMLQRNGFPRSAVSKILIHRSSSSSTAKIQFLDVSISARVQKRFVQVGLASQQNDSTTSESQAYNPNMASSNYRRPTAGPSRAMPAAPVSKGHDLNVLSRKRSSVRSAQDRIIEDMWGDFAKFARSSDAESNGDVTSSEEPQAQCLPEDDLAADILAGRVDQTLVQDLIRDLARPLSRSQPTPDRFDESSEDESSCSSSAGDIGSQLSSRAQSSNHRNVESSNGSHKSISGATMTRNRRLFRKRSPVKVTNTESSETDEVSKPSASAGSSVNPARQQHQVNQAKPQRTITIPKAEYARGRRVLVSEDLRLPFATVAMRGDIHFVHRTKMHRISTLSLPIADSADVSYRHVEDACLVWDDTVVVGYSGRKCQITLIPLRGDQACRRVDIAHKAHSKVSENRKAGTSSPNHGIRSLAPISGTSKFLSGGFDKTVQLWIFDPAADFDMCSQELKSAHSGVVRALAYRTSDNTVFSCSEKTIHAFNISAIDRTPGIYLSNKINQIHVSSYNPAMVILEVDHLDHQVQLFDTRQASFDRPPCLQFGYRSVKAGSRYTKGSAIQRMFGRGYEDGVVRCWDYSNTSNVVDTFQSTRNGMPPAPVVHTVLSGHDIIAYGSYVVTCW